MVREKNKPSHPRIYTAGAMHWKNDEDSHWRRSIDTDISDVSFYHPTEGYFDHGGDLVDGAVAEDMHAIEMADGLIAYYTETPQIGTTVEVMHAIQAGKPTLVLFTPSIVNPTLAVPNPTESQTGTMGTVTARGAADHHWFLINYINGDRPNATQRTVPDWITEWTGPDHATTAIADNDSLTDIIENWLTDTYPQ